MAIDTPIAERRARQLTGQHYAETIKSMVANRLIEVNPDPTRTDSNADGCKSMVRMEIAINEETALITSVTGDVMNVLGCDKSEMINEDLFKFFELDQKITQKAWNDMHENNCAYKENTLTGRDGHERKVRSFLTWGVRGKILIERIFLK